MGATCSLACSELSRDALIGLLSAPALALPHASDCRSVRVMSHKAQRRRAALHFSARLPLLCTLHPTPLHLTADHPDFRLLTFAPVFMKKYMYIAEQWPDVVLLQIFGDESPDTRKMMVSMKVKVRCQELRMSGLQTFELTTSGRRALLGVCLFCSRTQQWSCSSRPRVRTLLRRFVGSRVRACAPMHTRTHFGWAPAYTGPSLRGAPPSGF
jgi:hypothetical protein